ncbi:TPA: hypothetical protein DEO28_03605 [Candidatus Dependentiae bacterium]|nr:MAG: ligase protein [candidate division TM6 bacterium GW2011_GWE2_31_21]KKP53617.1 MAG: ligase protein [candidate division TM6 bacterium GW2011_GWF2_33_332]HBS48143.1 hypothetical protein [Candidatus Dependentiae bacterium]HBZ73567.1 hypothetical protein [Candidatus Dependentiae bacterium]
MNKKVLIIIFSFFSFALIFEFCILKRLQADPTEDLSTVQFAPEDEAKIKEEYKKMFGADLSEEDLREAEKFMQDPANLPIIEEIAKGIEQEIQKQQETVAPKEPEIIPPQEPQGTKEDVEAEKEPSADKETSEEKVEIPQDKKTNFLQPWKPVVKKDKDADKLKKEKDTPKTPEKPSLPKHKKEAFDFYIGQFKNALASVKSNIANLDVYKRSRLKIFEKELNSISTSMGSIQNDEIYQISFFNAKFNSLRSKILEFLNELKSIDQDFQISAMQITITPPISKEELLKQEAGKEQSLPTERGKKEFKPAYERIKKIEESAKDTSIKTQETPKTEDAALATETWYQRIINAIKNGFITSWDFIKNIFSKTAIPKQTSEPQTVKVAVNDPTDESIKQLTTHPPFVGKEILDLPTKNKAPKQSAQQAPQPSTENIVKMALNRIRKTLERYLPILDKELKEVIKFSKPKVTETKKEVEQKIKAAEEKRKAREKKTPSSGYYNYPSYYSSGSPGGYNAPSYGGYGSDYYGGSGSSYPSYSSPSYRSGGYSSASPFDDKESKDKSPKSPKDDKTSVGGSIGQLPAAADKNAKELKKPGIGALLPREKEVSDAELAATENELKEKILELISEASEENSDIKTLLKSAETKAASEKEETERKTKIDNKLKILQKLEKKISKQQSKLENLQKKFKSASHKEKTEWQKEDKKFQEKYEKFQKSLQELGASLKEANERKAKEAAAPVALPVVAP